MISNSAQSPAPRRTPHLFEIRVLRTVPKIPREEHSTIPSKIIPGVPLMGEHTSFSVNVFWSSLVLRTSYSGGRAGRCVSPNEFFPVASIRHDRGTSVTIQASTVARPSRQAPSAFVFVQFSPLVLSLSPDPTPDTASRLVGQAP